MRNMKDIARFVWNMFVNTNCFKAMTLTLHTQKLIFDFKNISILKNLSVYSQGSSAENSCKNNAPRHLNVQMLLYRAVEVKVETPYLIVYIRMYLY